jgi:hypothetical protein
MGSGGDRDISVAAGRWASHLHDVTRMSPTHVDHQHLVAALQAAHAAGRGVPPDLEPLVRAYAAGRRAAGDPVERILVDVKELLHETVGSDIDLFKHRIVGWTVAGFFAGSSKGSGADAER